MMQMQSYLSLHSPSLRMPPLRPVYKPFSPTRRNRNVAVAATVARPKQQHPAAAATMYELLSVSEAAGPDEIKAAYRRQARRWHPDTCPPSGDKSFFAQQFMRAREAYEVLSDPVVREDYDLSLRAGAPHGNWADALGGSVFRNYGDRGRARAKGGFGDWETQLEGLKRRMSAQSAAAANTWGSRMRSGELRTF